MAKMTYREFKAEVLDHLGADSVLATRVSDSEWRSLYRVYQGNPDMDVRMAAVEVARLKQESPDLPLDPDKIFRATDQATVRQREQKKVLKAQLEAQAAEAETVIKDKGTSNLEKNAARQAQAGAVEGLEALRLKSISSVPQWMLKYTGGVTPSNKQVRLLRDLYEGSHGVKFDSRADFLSDPRIANERPEIANLLQTVVLGDGTATGKSRFLIGKRVVQTDDVTGAGGVEDVFFDLDEMESAAAQVSTGAVAAMPNVLRAANDSGAPWQLIWGYLRAQSGFDTANPGGLAGVGDDDGSSFAGEAQTNPAKAPRWVAEKLVDGYRQYGDWTIAALAARYPAAAAALYRDGFLDQNEHKEALAWLRRVSGTAKSGMNVALEVLGYGDGAEASSATFEDILQLTAEPLPVLDPRAVEQSAQALFRSWFQIDPNPDQLAQLTNTITSTAMQAAVAKRKASNPFNPQSTYTEPDPDARATDTLRGMPEYGRLFGNKPANLTEEEYAAQFQRTGMAALGQAASADAVRAGMASGNADVTRRAAGSSQMAGPGNELGSTTTFRERLYQTAQLLEKLF